MLPNRASTWATCLISANEENKYTVIPSTLRFPKLQRKRASRIKSFREAAD
jgi:hypothetical protein